MSNNFNLLDQRWLPVIWNNGTPDKVGIREALLQAGKIRQIAASNPMDRIAIVRFLLALLQWCKPAPSPDEIATLASGRTLPERWFEQLETYREKFELLGNDAGFYQEYAAWLEYCKGNKSRKEGTEERKDKFNAPTNLLSEMPSGTNVAHFRHLKDGREGVCPACCAVGILRLSAFTTHSAHPPYHGGKPSGINGPTPVYAIPLGETLLETLRLNWPMRPKEGDRPGWASNDCRTRERIGCAAAFTWRPRRIWLDRPREKQPEEVCSYCGQRDKLIREIAFLPGWDRPYAKESWPEDPHLLLLWNVRKAKGAKPKSQSVGLPNVSFSEEFHARLWRKLYAALLCALSQNLKEHSPEQHRHIREAFSKNQGKQEITVAFFGAAVANQALYQDALSLEWRFPAVNLTQAGLQTALAELAWLNELKPWVALAQALPRNARKRPEISASLAADASHTESVLRDHFERFFKALLSAEVNACDSWRSQVKSALDEQVREAQAALVAGSAFRTRISARRAQASLEKLFRQPRRQPAAANLGQLAKEGNDDAYAD